MRNLLLVVFVMMMISGPISAQQGALKAKLGAAKETIKAKLSAAAEKWKNRAGSREPNAERGAWLEKIKARWQEKHGEGAGEKFQAMKQRWQEMRDQNPGLQSLEEKLKAFQDARSQRDENGMGQRRQEMLATWEGLGEKLRSAIREKIPELAERFKRWQETARTGSVGAVRTGSDGRTLQYTGAENRQGNIRTHQGTWTDQNGRQVNVHGRTLRESKSWTTDKTWTGEDGKSVAGHSVTAADGNNASFERKFTGSEGKTTTVTGVHVLNGNTISTEKTHVGPLGGETSVSGVTTIEQGKASSQWKTSDGKTWSHETVVSKDDGKVHVETHTNAPDGHTHEGESDWIFDIFETDESLNECK